MAPHPRRPGRSDLVDHQAVPIAEPATDGLGDVLSDRPGLVWLAVHKAGPSTLWSHNQLSPDLVLWARETVEN